MRQAKQSGVRWCGWIFVALLFRMTLLGSVAQTSPDPATKTTATGPLSGDAAAETPADSELVLAAALKPWHGDFAAIVERGFIRIVIPHDPMFLAYDGDRLIGLAAEGLADVAMANLTITPERAAVVAFTEPLLRSS